MSGGIIGEKGPGDMKLVYSQARDQCGLEPAMCLRPDHRTTSRQIPEPRARRLSTSGRAQKYASLEMRSTLSPSCGEA